MNNYIFTDATGYTLVQLSEMHNNSFHGYITPVEMAPQQTADFWRTYQIDATRSVVMHDQAGEFVGMARMGTRGVRGWCSGFGIVPAFRGTGASTLLAKRMVQVAQESGLRRLQLGVLAQDSRAIKLYKKVGFTVERQLFVLEIAVATLPPGRDQEIKSASIEMLLPQLHQVYRPCWRTELTSLLALGAEAFVLPAQDGHINGIVTKQRGKTVTLVAAVLQDTLTDVDLAALLRYAAGDAETLQVINEPEESPFLARYLQLGFSEIFHQYEMFLELDA